MTTRRTAIRSAAGLLGLLVSPASAGTVSAAQGSALKFEIYKDSRNELRWRLKSANGQVIATPGEGYKTRVDCRKAIESIKRGAGGASIVELP